MMGSIPAAVMKAATAGAGLKLGIVGIAMAAGIAFTLAGAEASGDPFGDAASVEDGQVSGDPNNALGTDDGVIVQVGNGGVGGELVVSFQNNFAYNGAGADIRIHTLDTEAPAEATIDVSAGDGWVTAGDFFDDDGDIDIDLGALGLDFATMVRITYLSGPEPGFDVDAVEALNQVGEDTSIELAPANNADPGFAEHVVTATVTDSVDGGGDIAIEGVVVSFAVISGPSTDETGSGATDVAGQESFGWTAPAGGLDTVIAWLDIDGSGSHDPGEPSSEATKLWFGDTGTIDLIDVDGGDLAEGELVEIEVSDRDLDMNDGLDTVEVNVSSSLSDPTGISVILTETEPHSGVFSGIVELSDASNDALDQLKAVVGDVITGTYADAVDENGETPEPVTDSLTVELTAEEDELLEALDEDGQKVTVCHIPPGNPANHKTLEIGEPALDAHLAHGDVEGDCADVDFDEEDLQSPQERAQERKAERDEAFCERKGDDHPRCRADD